MTATLGVLALGACSDPELNTDLRPEGPPDVLAVLVMTDAASQLSEKATYCKAGDELRPTLVGLPDFTTQEVCPETGNPAPVTTAYPDGWYVRIMFDELLDPSFEELTPILDEDTGENTGASTGSIAGSNPVTLQCRSVTNNQFVNVDYDGYYSPSGNRVTWPVGPSIVIKPNDPTLIATNTECQVTINAGVLFDKQGEEVPAAQRGPFTFSVAPITPLYLDPPVDDPDYESPIDAVTMYYDNVYVQFNTTIDPTSICPDDDGDGLCDSESTFSFTDNEHPTEGPGYCNVSFEPCGTLADCPSGGGDTLCGRGFCGVSGEVCNAKADCPDASEHCGTSYAYGYAAFGLDDTQWGIGPIEPIQTDRKYTFKFTEGAMLRDRCGKATTLAAPSAADLTLGRFVTNKFDFNGATIVTGEVASAMKRLQFNFNNVLVGSDTATGNDTSRYAPSPAFADAITNGDFTISPLPKVLTAACPGGGAACATADITPGEMMIVSPNADGQVQLSGHLQMDTEYTATLKANTVIADFFGVEWKPTEDMVIKWKTQPAITMTGITLRNSDLLFGAGNNGRLVKTGANIDIRFGFNASIDPTTFDATDIKVEPAVPGITFNASGCGGPSNLKGWLGTCTMRARAPADSWPVGTYKITLLGGAKVKDIFGVEYTHPADTTITVTVVEASGTAQCL